ncbi:MAG: hypothetical protein P1U89_21110 [Verrucomicrobiales bacterium]|nr:hypothetical protein [Verrucomicrobiales bacterium]
MQFSLGHQAIPEALADSARKFQTAESDVRDLLRPALKGVEKSQWEKVHTHLLDILIEGNEVANRMEIYREIGRISFGEARKLSNKIEDHIEDVIIVKSILEGRSCPNEHIKVLNRLQSESGELLTQLRNLRSKFLR